VPRLRGGVGQVAVVGDRDPAAGGVGLGRRLGVLPARAAGGGVAGVADGQVPPGRWPVSPRRTRASPAPSPGRRACRDRRRRPCRPTLGRGAGSASSPSYTRLATGFPGAQTRMPRADGRHLSRSSRNGEFGRGTRMLTASAPRIPISDPCYGDGPAAGPGGGGEPEPDRLRRPLRSRQAMAADRGLTVDPRLLPPRRRGPGRVSPNRGGASPGSVDDPSASTRRRRFAVRFKRGR
jgi:hypothetical protein